MSADAVFSAIGDGDVEALKKLLEDNPDFSVDCVNEDKSTPLHAAADGETECMKVLLKAKGAAEALKMKNGDEDEPMTPLMAAIKYDDDSLVSLMLDPSTSDPPLEGAAAAEKTDEAVEFAKKLDGAPAVLALFGVVKEEKEKAVNEDGEPVVAKRRVSVSGNDINDFSKTFQDEAKNQLDKRAARNSTEMDIVTVSEETLKAIHALPSAAQAEIFAKLTASGWVNPGASS